MRAVPISPQMADLPLARIQPYTRPFTYTGVDFFGPINVFVKDKKEKRYGCLFTCLTTRAVHLESANSLSSETFLLLLKIFICRRGTPVAIYSDRGTNFRGASRELAMAVKNLNHYEIQNTMSSIKWFFNPPASPHMGGAWERMVRAVKSCLMESIRCQKLSDDVFRTMLAEVENVVNSRPLTDVPLNSCDEDPLTSNHFILGSSNGIRSARELKDDGGTLRRIWRISSQLCNKFWRKWPRDFLPSITRRTKWYNPPTKPIEFDDVVVIVDGMAPRNQWEKGRVVDLNFDRYGTARSAVVKTNKGLYTRPTIKLAVLDVLPAPKG